MTPIVSNMVIIDLFLKATITALKHSPKPFSTSSQPPLSAKKAIDHDLGFFSNKYFATSGLDLYICPSPFEEEPGMKLLK